jgi:hypothetical protein
MSASPKKRKREVEDAEDSARPTKKACMSVNIPSNGQQVKRKGSRTRKLIKFEKEMLSSFK